jgi:hypothetical protein
VGEPAEDALERLLAGGVAAVVGREDGDRDPLVAVAQERDLVIDPAGARAPAALEVDAPAGQLDGADAPALARDDRPQEVEPVGAVSARQQRVDVQEEPGLVSRGDPAVAPDRAGGLEAAHACRGGEPLESAHADPGEDRGGRVVVGAADHRAQEGLLGPGERPGPGAAREGDQQHRLQHACAREDAIDTDAGEAAVGAHGERDDPWTLCRVLACGGNVDGRDQHAVSVLRRKFATPAGCIVVADASPATWLITGVFARSPATVRRGEAPAGCLRFSDAGH